MSHSILQCNGRSAIVHDTDLSILLGLMANVIADDEAQFGLVRALVGRAAGDRWHCGPGTMDIDLTALDGSNDATKELVALLDAVERRLELFGSVIPRAALTSLEGRAGVSFSGDLPALGVREAIRSLRSLLPISPGAAKT